MNDMNVLEISFGYDCTRSNTVELHVSDRDADFLFWLSGFMLEKCDVDIEIKRIK